MLNSLFTGLASHFYDTHKDDAKHLFDHVKEHVATSSSPTAVADALDNYKPQASHNEDFANHLIQLRSMARKMPFQAQQLFSHVDAQVDQNHTIANAVKSYSVPQTRGWPPPTAPWPSWRAYSRYRRSLPPSLYDAGHGADLYTSPHDDKFPHEYHPSPQHDPLMFSHPDAHATMPYSTSMYDGARRNEFHVHFHNRSISFYASTPTKLSAVLNDTIGLKPSLGGTLHGEISFSAYSFPQPKIELWKQVAKEQHVDVYTTGQYTQ